MEKKLLSFIQENNLIEPGERILVAASAGVDSTVLCHLLARNRTPFAIGHCNFQLRGPDSDGDEMFILNMAEMFGVPFFCEKFKTEDVAKERKLSIQEAARDLRYDWLNHILETHNYDLIATAHHLDDSIETLLYNFAKGCGLKGLHGILPKQGNLIRPLLFATKKELVALAQQENIQWREDASNITDKYARNKIRHHVVPVLEEINPAFQKTAGETIQRLRDAEALYDFAIRQIKMKVYAKSGHEHHIDIEKLFSSLAPATVLYELLKPFGFNNAQTEQILQSVENQPGKFFYARTWRLLTDRSALIIAKMEGGKTVHVIDSVPENPVWLKDCRLGFRLIEKKPVFISKNGHSAWLDYDKLTFPLLLRHWEPGDYFQPFGMNGKRQKLQDFFTNNKVSRIDKEKIWLLESAGEICWVVGMRLDERFKVSEDTKRCLVAEFEPLTFADDKMTW